MIQFVKKYIIMFTADMDFSFLLDFYRQCIDRLMEMLLPMKVVLSILIIYFKLQLKEIPRAIEIVLLYESSLERERRQIQFPECRNITM